MNFVDLLSRLFSLGSKLVQFFNRRELKKAGKDEYYRESMQQADAIIAKANHARDSVSADTPGDELYSSDPNCRD